jgi:hypothetical protein
MKYFLPAAMVLAFYAGLIAPAVRLYNRPADSPAPNSRQELLNKLK